MTDTSQETRDLARLENEIEDMARKFVADIGGYPPFGGTLDNKGQISLIVTEMSIDPLNTLLAQLRASAASGATVAAGIARMARVADPGGQQRTAIVISLHHRQGKCIDYFIPFLRAPSGTVSFGQPFAGIGETRFF